MYKLQLTGQSLGQGFNSRSDCMSAIIHLFSYEAKQPNLKLKTWSKQLLGSLLLTLALPGIQIQGKNWAEFSTLEVTAYILFNCSAMKQNSLT